MFRKILFLYFIMIPFAYSSVNNINEGNIAQGSCSLNKYFFSYFAKDLWIFPEGFRYNDGDTVVNGETAIYTECTKGYDGYVQYICKDGKIDLFEVKCSKNCIIPSKTKYYAGKTIQGGMIDEYFTVIDKTKLLKPKTIIKANHINGYVFKPCSNNAGYEKYICDNGIFKFVSSTCQNVGSCSLNNRYYRSSKFNATEPEHRYKNDDIVENGNVDIYESCGGTYDEGRYLRYKCYMGKLSLIEDKC